MNSTPNYQFDKTVNICALDGVDREIKRLEDRVDATDSALSDRYTKEEVDCKISSKADRCAFEKHLVDPDAHEELFEGKVDKVEGCRLICEDELEAYRNKIRDLEEELAQKVNQSQLNILTDSKILYVRKEGSDVNGDGSHEAPFLTIQKALDTIMSYYNPRFDVYVYIGDGVYQENLSLKINMGGMIYLKGESEDADKVIIRPSSGRALTVYDVPRMQIDYLTFEKKDTQYVQSGFVYMNNTNYNFNYCKIVSDTLVTSQWGLYVTIGTQGYVRYCEFTNWYTAMYASSYGVLAVMRQNTGAGNTTAYYADHAIIIYSGTTPTATTIAAAVGGGQTFTG